MSSKSVKARLVGIIGKSHGIKGEVVVKLLTDYPKTFKKGDILFLDEECSEKVKIENIKLRRLKGADRAILKFDGINDRNSAESFRNKFLYRNVKNAPELGKDEFWVDDLINCLVYSVDGNFIGRVVDVEKNPSNDNLVIKKENQDISIKGIKGDVFLLPVIESYIEKVDIKNKKIVLKKIPEYI